MFYGALATGLITFIIWISLSYPVSFAIERMVTVLIIAYPHALGLAAPLVVAVSTSLAAKNGLLIRNRAAFEGARNIEAIVFDKTGTLTKGGFGVTNIDTFKNFSKKDVISFAAAVEAQSQHPLAKGVTRKAEEMGIPLQRVERFQLLTGKGSEGTVHGKQVMVVSPGYVKELNLKFDNVKFDQWSSEGKTVVFTLIDKKLVGIIALADIVCETAVEAVKKLKEINVKSIMLTGDNEKVAHYIGKTTRNGRDLC